MSEAEEVKTSDSMLYEKYKKYLILRIGKNVFGVLVQNVEDVLFPQKIANIPLAPQYILGVLNLRGRIVTAIDLGIKLGIDPVDTSRQYRSIVIEKNNHLYSLLVDDVSEVIDIPNSKISNVPENLSDEWKKVSLGVHTMEDDLMVIIDAYKIIGDNKDETEDE